MNYKNIIPYVLIGFLFAGMALYVYQVKSESNGLKNAIERVDKELERQKETHKATFDSLQIKIDSQDVVLTELKNQVPEIENKIRIINRKSNENKDKINRITSADTLALLLTRRYRQ